MKHKKTGCTLIAGILSLSIYAFSNAAVAAEKPGMEKCYGIAKAGKNDCGLPPTHSCAGQSKVDGAAADWIYVPKGMCSKIVNGVVK
ncbi:MAG: DUF2282 domain-containing protein [Gammaproteobacteria bacterium]|nr:DUF2282 domain-containing protein [Gammaproteobacteria bacterium]